MAVSRYTIGDSWYLGDVGAATRTAQERVAGQQTVTALPYTPPAGQGNGQSIAISQPVAAARSPDALAIQRPYSGWGENLLNRVLDIGGQLATQEIGRRLNMDDEGELPTVQLPDRIVSAPAPGGLPPWAPWAIGGAALLGVVLIFAVARK